MSFRRGLNGENPIRFSKDFVFLFDSIRRQCGELDLRLRNDYFNVYYRGNSLAKVKFLREDYDVQIHKEFGAGVFDEDRFGAPRSQGNYLVWHLKKGQLPSFLQSRHIKSLAKRIKNRNFSEETAFEQMLITDNMDRSGLILIDRQIEGGSIPGRMDLLALRQVDGDSNRYHFLILELKMGNSSDLTMKVAAQLKGYINAVTKDFDQFKASYECVYRQLKAVGMFPQCRHSEVDIVKGVQGLVVVGGYSGLADKALRQLRQYSPGTQFTRMHHVLKLEPQASSSGSAIHGES